jgi:hypothetical protein
MNSHTPDCNLLSLTPIRYVAGELRKQHSPLALFAVLATLLATLSLSGCVGLTSAGTPAKSGSGNSPYGTLAASATSVSFGNVATGSSNSQTLTLTNTGTAAVAISQATVAGAGFSVVGGMTSVSIAAGQNQAFQIQFAPKTAGNVSGSIVVASDASDPTLSVSLSGTGMAPGATFLLNANKASLPFGNVNVGSSSTLGVTFTNAGNSNVTVSSVTIAGAGFNTASGGLTGQILTPGQTATLNVTFTPVTAVTVPGSVTVTSNATNSPATITLSGTGVQPGPHSVTLNWTASTSTVAGYYGYRSTVTGGPYTKLNSTPVKTTQDTDSTVQSGLTYFYVVTSVDLSNVESTFSNEVSATVPTP